MEYPSSRIHIISPQQQETSYPPCRVRTICPSLLVRTPSPPVSGLLFRGGLRFQAREVRGDDLPGEVRRCAARGSVGKEREGEFV